MSDTFQALGWTLVHFCWQATVLAVLYLAGDFWFKKGPSQTRYLFTLATLLSMFILSVATLGYETVRYSAEVSVQVSNAPIQALATSNIEVLAANDKYLANRPAQVQLTPLLPWIDFAWLLGVLVFALRSVGGWWWLQRLRCRTMEEVPEAIQTVFLKVSAKLGITRMPELRIAKCISVPMTLGVLHSLVLLPACALLVLSPDHLEAILAHELAHVRRADYFWNLFQTLTETLFFFHPAVWWIGRRLKEQRELCCDDMAIEKCSDPLVYATALFRLEDQRSVGLNLAMALDGHQSRSNFRARILRIFGEGVPQSRKSGLRPLSLLVVCVGLFLYLSPLPKGFGSISSQHLRDKQVLPMPERRKESERRTELLVLQAPTFASTSGQVTEERRSNANKRMRKLPAAGLASHLPPAKITNEQGSSANAPPPHIDSTSLMAVNLASHLLPAKITEKQGSNAVGPPPHIRVSGSNEISLLAK